MSDDDFGTSDLDPQERKDAQTYLEDPNDSDDEPWSPPDRQPRAGEFTDDDEQETIDQRVAQEEPEAGTAYGDPDDEDHVGDDRRTYVGGDDPDAVPAEQDFLGDPDETENEAPAPNAADEPAEQSALHVIDDDQRFPTEEDVNADSDEETDYPG